MSTSGRILKCDRTKHDGPLGKVFLSVEEMLKYEYLKRIT
jgi:hypothetical protein